MSIHYLVVEPDGSVVERDAESITNSLLYEQIGQFRSVVGPEGNVVFMRDVQPGEDHHALNWLVSNWANQYLHPADRVFDKAIIAGPTDDDGHVTSVDSSLADLLRSRNPKTTSKASSS